jgi:hypothetical protein
MGVAARLGKERPSFLKKRSKKLLHSGPRLSGEAQPRIQKFFGSFFVIAHPLYAASTRIA